MVLNRGKGVEVATLQAQHQDAERRVRQLERELAELRGEVHAMRDAARESRTALREELGRVMDVVRGPAGAAGFDSMKERWAAAAGANPEDAEKYRKQIEARRSRYDEQHGAGISQEEMIRRMRAQEGTDGGERSPEAER